MSDAINIDTSLDVIMAKVQEYASTWSSVGGVFDTRNMRGDAEHCKSELTIMIHDLLLQIQTMSNTEHIYKREFCQLKYRVERQDSQLDNYIPLLERVTQAEKDRRKLRKEVETLKSQMAKYEVAGKAN